MIGIVLDRTRRTVRIGWRRAYILDSILPEEQETNYHVNGKPYLYSAGDHSV